MREEKTKFKSWLVYTTNQVNDRKFLQTVVFEEKNQGHKDRRLRVIDLSAS
jgi:hypothetical protein